MPLQKCPACGSTWFREALFYEFVPARPWLYEEEERSQEMTILICLCGQPITPPLSAGAGPRIWQTIQRLLKCLEQVQKRSDFWDRRSSFSGKPPSSANSCKPCNHNCGRWSVLPPGSWPSKRWPPAGASHKGGFGSQRPTWLIHPGPRAAPG